MELPKENLSPVTPYLSPHSPPPYAHLHAFTELCEGRRLVLIPPMTKPALDLSDIPVQLL